MLACQHYGRVNTAAQSTLRQDPHPGSQQVGTINTPSAQSTIRHHHQSGPVNTLAQSTLRHSQHSGTVNAPAQSTLRHHYQSGTVIIWTTHRRQFLLKADATRVSFSSFSVSTGSILMRVGRPREYFLLCRSCPSEGAWWAVLECRSCRSVDCAGMMNVPPC